MLIFERLYGILYGKCMRTNNKHTMTLEPLISFLYDFVKAFVWIVIIINLLNIRFFMLGVSMLEHILKTI